MTALSALPAVGLEEISERAGRMTRVDRKYLVPRATAHRLLDGLADRVRVLTISGCHTFRYRSTYYDTADLSAFQAAATARRRRAKVRSREYLDTGTAFLEVKTPTGRGESSKQRIPLSPGAADGPMDEVSVAFVAHTLESAGIPVPTMLLTPVLTTRYDRSTLLIDDEDSRLTIDAGLLWSIPGTNRPVDSRRHAAELPSTSRALNGLVVLETKAGTRPCTADRLLWADGHRPVRLSKYATGLVLLDPRLPHHRWHRTLQALRTAL